MMKRRSKEEWSQLVEEYISSGLTLTAWCNEKSISKSSIYLYIKKYAEPVETSLIEPKRGTITIPKSGEIPLISFKIGSIGLDIKNGCDKKTLSEVLSVVMTLC